MKKVVAAVFGAMCLMLLLNIQASAKEIWVSAGASGNGTEASPYGTIQQAANVAQPGDTVMIKPGVYYEQVDFKGAGTKENPIIFRATEYGRNKVIITRADKDIREGKVEWTLEDAARNIYSIPYDEKPMRILYQRKASNRGDAEDRGANLVRYGKYEYLKELKYVGVTASDNGGNRYSDFATMKDGFFYDAEAKKLYVRLRADEKYGDINPNNNIMSVSPKEYTSFTLEDGTVLATMFNDGISTDSYCFGIVGEKPAYTVLYGLTFETPGFTGVFVRGSDVTVSNCFFEGCANGVRGGRYYNIDKYITDRVTVEYCEWGAWPHTQDVYELMEEGESPTLMTTWHIKNVTWSDNCYEVGTLVGAAGNDWVIRNNYVHDTLDALSFYAWCTWGEMINGRTFWHCSTSAEIYENRFEDLTDNAIELEEHASGFDIHHNEMINTLVPFSIQPGNGTPWPTNHKIHHNILYQNPEKTDMYVNNGAYSTGNRYSQGLNPNFNYDRGFLLKVGFSMPGNYNFPWSPDEMLYSGFVRPAKTLNYEDEGVHLYNNILYSPNTMFWAMAGRQGGDRGENSNFKLTNNIISCLVTSPDYANDSGTYFYKYGDVVGKTVAGRNTLGVEFVSNMFIPTNGQTLNEDSTVLDNGGIVKESYAAAGIPGLAEGNYELSDDSPAIGAGTKVYGEKYSTTDIGPLAKGESWSIKYAPYKFGDVNCDTKVDENDIFAVMNLVGTTSDDEKFASRADLDFNGIINNVDLQIITDEYSKVIQ